MNKDIQIVELENEDIEIQIDSYVITWSELVGKPENNKALIALLNKLLEKKLDKRLVKLKPATHTKITYNEEGLVVAGKDLSIEDLPTLRLENIVDVEKPYGAIVQFGGQTAINLADSLVEHGVKILGTSLHSIDLAEDRHEFEAMLHKLDIPQPRGETAVTVEESLVIANKIGYPVLVRPSYVLGGRAMEIVHNDDELRVYMATAVKEISHDAPILVDKYIVGKELEIDAIADGKNVYIPGVMEHIERAGIHSGDSISVYPTQIINEKVKETIIDYGTRIGEGFEFVGLYNIQFIVDKENNVYVLEVNPRSSRTVPFLSKITGVPMSQIATKCVLGESIEDQGLTPGYHPEDKERVFVKAPVFSFAKLRSVDTVLGPEMKSTGEVLGVGETLEEALYKGFMAAGRTISDDRGMVLATVNDHDKEEFIEIAKEMKELGYTFLATEGTAKALRKNDIDAITVNKIGEGKPNILDAIMNNQVDMVINTPTKGNDAKRDGFKIRRTATEYNVDIMTSLDTLKALVKVTKKQINNHELKVYNIAE